MEPAREVPLKELSTDNVLRGFSLHTQCNTTQILVTQQDFKNENTRKECDKSDISYLISCSDDVSDRASAPKNLLRENLMHGKVITIWSPNLGILELFRAAAHL